MEGNEVTTLERIINSISQLWPFLIGGGGLIGFVQWRKDKYKFDVRMNELRNQNKQLTNSLISYVPRKTLDAALQEFLDSNYIVCAILGPAGSGKTRFALNITKRNSRFSKFHYVYIDNKSGTFFASDYFKNNYTIKGNRRYVFIFDYIFENVMAINNLLDKALKTGKHKFIFVERDYGWSEKRLLDRPQFQISMEEHKMTYEMLSAVFCNQVNLLNKKYRRKNIYDTALKFTKIIVDKIDPVYSRPIFAQLVASIFAHNENFDLSKIDNISEIVEQYWYYKFDKDKISSVVYNHLDNIDSYFVENLEILLRIILLVASISKRKIVVTKKDKVIFQIGDKNKDEDNLFYDLILDSCDETFIDKLNHLEADELKQVFGIILKDYVKPNSRGPKNTFEIFAELDLISEWVLSDSLKKENDWVKKIVSFLSVTYRENYIAFLRRSSIDFPDVIELFGSEEMEFINLLLQRINEAYLPNHSFGYIAIGVLTSGAKKIYSEEIYNNIVIKALEEIKKCYIKTQNKELTEQLYELVGGIENNE